MITSFGNRQWSRSFGFIECRVSKKMVGFEAVLGIRYVLVRIRICRSVPLTNGSGSGSNSGSDSFLQCFYRCIFFLKLIPRHIIFGLKNLIFAKIVKILFYKHYFSEPDPDPYLWQVDPDPRGPKTCGSGSTTLIRSVSSLHLWDTASVRYLSPIILKGMAEKLKGYIPDTVPYCYSQQEQND